MYTNLIKRLEEKFPEETFKVEKDDTGLYTISVDGKGSLKGRYNPETDITKSEDILFDGMSKLIQFISYLS